MASLITPAFSDGPADNQADQVRPIPPPGIKIEPAVIESLRRRCEAIRSDWRSLSIAGKTGGGDFQSPSPETATESRRHLESEVLVLPRAVEMAIEFNQFYHVREADWAAKLLGEAERRIDVVRGGGDWAAVMGIRDGSSQRELIGGYRSRIDGSLQPYSVIIPQGLGQNDVRPRRLDVWFHGRGETQSEVAFLAKQSELVGKFHPGQSFTPSDTIVLHPYGRYCNAFRFAGEIDVLEALAHVQSRLPVDGDRISVRGFSMGGAGCWQFATRYADRWFAANPGAGFSETAEFLRTFQGENVRETMPLFQQTLWQLYDNPPLAVNLTNCPLVAYSGAIDRQKQAADAMETALRELDIDMVHVIGPETGHSIHPQSRIEIERRMDSLSRVADNATPRRVRFATPTLRYHQMHWIDIQGLEQHWKMANIDARIIRDDTIEVQANNVTRLSLRFEPGRWPGKKSGEVLIQIGGQTLNGPLVRSDRSWQAHLQRDQDHWSLVEAFAPAGLVKRPGLQGPIDDALMDSFLFVLPSGKSNDPVVQKWIEDESHHAMDQWQRHFRGDIRAVQDEEVDPAMMESNHLILFGDYQSNTLIKRLIDLMPIRWDGETIQIGDHSVPSAGHVAAMIYPNPVSPNRYVVLNSGFTYREYDYLNNARQTPKLPDWALIDVRGGATTQLPGVLSAVGFFDETWLP
ncbi:prolyl oligopeptidase family serine peptidase [Neorhodopirellula pilleata]|uniref:prolyl oligopeptidase family serine peptidase n=1 Tax=Neorhodopirellula pilleata TaxID=2714738 RepID=UPI0011B3ADC7|nr:prolyl oligopeptidase family serine peptidase [Neorhodopirellula pilleata]